MRERIRRWLKGRRRKSRERMFTRHRRRRASVHGCKHVHRTEDAQRLAFIEPGMTVELLCIHAGRRLTHRLNEMGLTPGVRMKVVQNSRGPVLISVRGTRIALGRGTAEKILVENLAI